MGTYLQDIQEQNNNGASPPIAGIFVVYDLPDRDCAALASNGELHIGDDGVAKYKGYIDSIRELLVEYSDVQTILVIGEFPLLDGLQILTHAQSRTVWRTWLPTWTYRNALTRRMPIWSAWHTR